MPLYLIAAFCLFLVLTSCGAKDQPAADDGDDVSSVTCKTLADSAVNMDVNQQRDVQLLKVRNPKMLVDHRETATAPKGDGSVLLMTCRGAGVYSDGTTVATRLRLTADSDGTTFVEFKPLA